MCGKLFLVSASSGAGKTTLVREVLVRLHEEHGVKRVITYTTKAPRPGEQQGIDYHFLSEDEFMKKIAQNFFVEHSTVYGAYYGFPRSVLHDIDHGAHYIAIVDRAGAASIKSERPDAILIWIKADKQVLEARLTSRAQDTQEVITFRLAIAEQELAAEQADDLYNHLILNDSLEAAIERLEHIIRNEVGSSIHSDGKK